MGETWDINAHNFPKVWLILQHQISACGTLHHMEIVRVFTSTFQSMLKFNKPHLMERPAMQIPILFFPKYGCIEQKIELNIVCYCIEQKKLLKKVPFIIFPCKRIISIFKMLDFASKTALYKTWKKTYICSKIFALRYIS